MANDSARLYSYVVVTDDGAAPNPYFGSCTLAICKPRIRRKARAGDWIAGLGAKGARDGKDHSGKLVYAMQVDEKLSFPDYDQRYREKRPDQRSARGAGRLGDNLYDYSKAHGGGEPALRPGVHTEENRVRDLGGKFVLISRHFVYFGSEPRPIPADLHGIIKQGQGHQVEKNAPYVQLFLRWLVGLSVSWNEPLASPQVWPYGEDGACLSARSRAEEALADEQPGCED